MTLASKVRLPGISCSLCSVVLVADAKQNDGGLVAVLCRWSSHTRSASFACSDALSSCTRSSRVPSLRSAPHVVHRVLSCPWLEVTDFFSAEAISRAASLSIASHRLAICCTLICEVWSRCSVGTALSFSVLVLGARARFMVPAVS